jgi:hypothetical protein
LIRTLAVEAETAISYMKETEQNYLRHAVAKSIKQLFRNNDQKTTQEQNKTGKS